MTNNEINAKKQEFLDFIFNNIMFRKNSLEQTLDTYKYYNHDNYKTELDFNKFIMLATFIIAHKAYYNFTIPKNKDILGYEDIFSLESENYRLVPGEKIKTEEEFKCFFAFVYNKNKQAMVKEKNVINDKVNSNEEELAKLNAKIDESINKTTTKLAELWMKSLINLFLTSYKKAETDLDFLKKFYDSAICFFENPTDKNHAKILKELQKIDVDKKDEILLNILEEYYNAYGFLEPEKKVKQEYVSLPCDKKEVKITYTDLKEENLSLEKQTKLKEMVELVSGFSKEDLKEFAADPLYYFELIDESYREKIINNFIIYINNNDCFEMTETITTKLMKFKNKG